MLLCRSWEGVVVVVVVEETLYKRAFLALARPNIYVDPISIYI
jgi:hypothetical protein